MSDEWRSMEEKNRRRAENFSIHIDEDDLNPASPRHDALHSYSDPEQHRTGTARQIAAAEHKAEKAHRVRNREKRFGNRWFFRIIWLCMVLLVSIVLGQYAVSGINDMLAVGRDASPTPITIDMKKSMVLDDVASLLEKNDLIDNVPFFKLYAKLTKSEGTFQNGTYNVQTNLDYQAIINMFQSNIDRVDTVKVTFKEGMNVEEIAALMEKNGVCKASEVIRLCKSSEYDDTFDLVKGIADADKRYYKLEGYLFADTYDFYMNEDPKTAVQKLVANTSKKLTAEIRNLAAARGLSINQVLTLASIVQAEAANEADMYLVSSVLQNRLSNGASKEIYTLDCDSTVYYPYRTKAAAAAAKGAEYRSTYDTYKQRGLPAGPICSPGEIAIDAVLNPESTKYYYFCHNPETKESFYATTYSQHQQNLKKAGLVS